MCYRGRPDTPDAPEVPVVAASAVAESHDAIMARLTELQRQLVELRAEMEVKGMRYPVRWACHQKLNEDGTLTLRPTVRAEV